MVQETVSVNCIYKEMIRPSTIMFQLTYVKENDTEPDLAADAYLTFIAILHQVYIQMCSSLLTHTCTHHHTLKHWQHYSFSTNYRRFLGMVPKKCSRELIKTVTDPDPGPSFIYFTTKWKRSEGQCSRTPLLRTLKQNPSLGLFKGGMKT